MSINMTQAKCGLYAKDKVQFKQLGAWPALGQCLLVSLGYDPGHETLQHMMKGSNVK